MFLTRRQQDVLTFVRRFLDREGVAPTLEEMARHFGLSRVTLHEHLRALERKGLLRRHPHRARGIELLDPPAHRSPAVRGVVNAGHPALACEDVEHGILDDWLGDRGARLFLLRVAGDSMIGDHITDGDFVVVDPESRPRPGDLVVARDEDGNATLKRLRLAEDHVQLEPSNPEYPVLRARNPEVVGVVVGVVRKL